MRKKIIDDPMDDIKLGKDMSRSRFRVVNSDITKLSERRFFNGFIQNLDLNRKKIWYPKQQECEGYLLISDYKYSKSLASYGKDWTFEELNGFLIKPSSYIKGTKMAYAGLRKEADRASVILYMNQNGDNPIPLP